MCSNSLFLKDDMLTDDVTAFGRLFHCRGAVAPKQCSSAARLMIWLANFLLDDARVLCVEDSWAEFIERNSEVVRSSEKVA